MDAAFTRGRSLYRLTRAACEGQKDDLEFNSPHDHGRCPDHRRYRLCDLALSTYRSQHTTVGPENRPAVDRLRTAGRLSALFFRSRVHVRLARRYVDARSKGVYGH